MRLRIAFALFLFPFYTYSQNLLDAARFSNQEVMGTARYVSMAGSFGALGGEVSSINSNPGGLGVFRSGQFSSSLLVGQNAVEGTHYGNSQNERRAFGRLSNISAVLSEQTDHPDWEYVNMYFGYNQKSVFTSRSRLSGVNNESSLLDLYLLDIIEDPDVTVESVENFFPFGAGLAWGAFLIDTLNGEYYHANEFHGQVQEREDQLERGVGHYSFGVGANYREKLYVGATIGFSALRFSSNSVYKETLRENDPNTFVKDWEQTSNISIRGNGVQVKLGAIYRPNKYIRIGASYRSQEFFRISEVYTTNISANWKDRESTQAASPESLNDYKFRSPNAFGLSFGVAKKKLGALNVDAEVVNYAAVKFITVPLRGIDFSALNAEIEQRFEPRMNLSVGAEKPIGPYAVRCGYSFRKGLENTAIASAQMFGLGFGYRFGLYAIDFGYSYVMESATEEYIHFAENINLSPSSIKRERQQFVLSLLVYFK